MIRMTGLDASFLYMEAPHLPMHTLKLGVLDLGRHARAVSLRARAREPARAPAPAAAPALARGAGAARDPSSGVGRGPGVRARRARATGDAAAARRAARVRRADRPHRRGPARPRRPLWAAVGGRGRARCRARAGRTSDSWRRCITRWPTAWRRWRCCAGRCCRCRDGADPGRPGPLPGPPAAGGALSAHLRQLTGLPRLLGHTARALLRARSSVAGPRCARRCCSRGRARCSTGRCRAARSFARVELALPADRGEIKARLGCTVNDVVLAVVAGRAAQLLDRPRRVGRRAAGGRGAGDHAAARTGRRESCGEHVHVAARRHRRPARAAARDPADHGQGQAAPRGARRRPAIARWLDFSRRGPYRLLWHRIVPRLRARRCMWWSRTCRGRASR
jgi:hypothetical protein